jgi:hypothetical protein
LIVCFDLIAIGVIALLLVAFDWSHRNFLADNTILSPILGTLAIALGLQTAFRGFLMTMIGGHEARFFARIADEAMPIERHEV